MAIRFHLARDCEDAVSVVYSPLLETVLSTHVLSDPKHHPIQHPWVRATRGLPATLKRELRAFRFATSRMLPGFVFPRPSGGYLAFGEEIEAVKALPVSDVAGALLRPLLSDHVDGPGPSDPRWFGQETYSRRALHTAREYFDGDVVAVTTLLLADPDAGRDRYLALLTRYWETAFAREWARLEPQLVAAVVEVGRDLASNEGLFSLLSRLAPRLRVDAQARLFGLDWDHEHRIEIGGDRRIAIAPSVYVWPHAAVCCDAPWEPALVYSAPALTREARPQLPPDDLVRILRATGDRTRLQILRLVGARPRSTQELAPLLGLSGQGTSRHLRILAEAGVLHARRDGYYVLYELDSDRLGPLGDEVLRFVHAPDGDSPGGSSW